MKKIFALAAVILISFSSHAQSLTLDGVCAGLAEKRNTKGKFIQEKTIGKNGRVLRSEGDFIFCSDGILWATTKPFPSKLAITPDRMVQVSSDGTKKVMEAKDNETFKSISSSMLEVFTKDASNLEKNFIVVFTTNENNKWTMTLEPKDGTAVLFMNRLVLNGKTTSTDSEIDSIELNEPKGNKVLYTFINQTHPKELTEDEKALFIER